MKTVLFTLVMMSVSLASAAPEVIWSIGKTDKSSGEFAFAGHHKDFSSKARTTPYVIGQDTPDTWPYIHPGPVDKWAGETTHPLTVLFNLDAVPKGECAVVAELTASYEHPKTYSAVLNGQVMKMNVPGGSGADSYDNDAAGRPQTVRLPFHPKLLKKGENTLELAVSSGCWIVYDSIRLESDPDASGKLITIEELQPSPFWVEAPEGLLQTVLLRVRNLGGRTEGSGSVRCNGEQLSRPVTLEYGENFVPLPVFEVSEPTSATAYLKMDSGSASLKGTVTPQKKWTVYIAPSIHTDIGYTHKQADVLKRHNENLDAVVELCKKNPLFKWNIEVAWEWQNYCDERSEAERKPLLDLMENKRLGMHAGYLNILTSLMSDEAMNRYCLYAADLRRDHGIDASTAILTDVPSATWSVPSVLAASGVSFFAEGCNQTRGPILINSGIREPFYWEGPDGARVLTWLANSYAQSLWLARAESLKTLQETVVHLLRPYEAANYPYDAIYVYGAFFDNDLVDKNYGRFLKEWEEKWAYPKMLVSTSGDFRDHMEKNYKDKIPVRKVDFGAYWEDGAGSTALETTIHLENQRRAAVAETLFGLASLSGVKFEFPRERLQKVWEDILFYAEHTWGAHNSISEPDNEFVTSQWAYKAEYAHRPARESEKLVQEALQAIARSTGARPGELLVMNPANWQRGGLVQLPAEIFDSQALKLRGKTVPVQKLDGETYAFVSDVPGWNAAVLRPGGAPAAEQKKESALENKYYKISTSSDGGIISIVDKESGKELIDKNSPHSFGAIVYGSGGEASSLFDHDRKARPKVVQNDAEWSRDPLSGTTDTLLVSQARIKSVDAGESGPLWDEVIVVSEAPSMPDVKTHVRLHHNEKRISFDVRITSKTEIRKKEAVYVAFPLATQSPKFRLGMTNSVSRPDKDFSKGACHEWYCVQDFVACAAGDAGIETVIAPLDAPLVCLSQINTGRWSPEPELTTGTIYSYIMNNYWMTNYKAGQGGDFRFRYELTSGNAGLSSTHCVKFARNAASPLLAVVAGESEVKEAKPVRLKGDGVAASLKLSHLDSGVVLRARNLEDSRQRIGLEAPGRTVVPVSLVEDPVEEGSAEVPTALQPQQTATLLLK